MLSLTEYMEKYVINPYSLNFWKFTSNCSLKPLGYGWAWGK